MKYRSCHDAYKYGGDSRIKYPLRSGLYKLVESNDRIKDSAKEICRIGDVINKREHPGCLMHCTNEDKAIWLRGVPLDIAYRMGYEIIPAFKALEFDDVDRGRAGLATRNAELMMPQLLAKWERLRNTYGRRISNEYDRMRNDESYALDIVNEALDVIGSSALCLPIEIQLKL